ncbi:helix-turn-helix domain-containing protein [Cytobacillus sp. FJAT-53684]|uniref:Helix-turn-helix domain-containing protein n=1 Tax=Cytobacillus mangrovibacter TaxID=3299024 RepID=A0ABW6K4P2_9BACI
MKEVRAVNPSFGSMVKYLRGKRGLSLREMTELTGISGSYINRIENGSRECPSYPIIEKISSALGVEPSDLLEVSSNKRSRSVVPLERLLFSSEFTVDGVKSLSPEAVELLLNLIDVVNDVSWEKETLIVDIYAICEAVDELKQELNN